MKKKQFKIVSGLIDVWRSKLLKIMKLTVVILCLSVIQSIALTTFGQNSKINLKMENTTIKQVLNSIEDQTNFFFIYNSKLVDVEKTISISIEQQNISDVLRNIFSNTNVSFEIDNRQILLFASENTSATGTQQQKSVSGKVTDNTGAGLPGVSVVVKGTTTGTITDANGNYSISNVPANATLQFSFVGMKSQEIAVAGKTTINVKLVEDAIGLDEVVAVGYGTQKKESLTGSVATVKSEKLTIAPVANITNAFGGQVAGVITKQSSGEPGRDAASISIRGFGSALVIVDGVESSLSNLDPNEIESVSVLKDASAAIYGARAGNGVILVTTKKGGINKPTINLNSTYSLQTVTASPKSMNAAQFSEIIREAQLNSGTPESGMMFSADAVRKYKEGTEQGYQGWNWYDAIMKDYAPMQQHNLSMSGGNDQFKYFGFLGYTNQLGMYRSRDNKMERYNMRVNLDGKINENLSVNLEMSSITSDLNSPSRSQEALWGDIYGALPTVNPILPDPTKIAWSGGITSPIAGTTSSLGGYQKGLSNQLFTTFSAKLDLPYLPGLSLKALVNYNQNTNENKNWTKGYDMYLYDAQGDKYIQKPGAFQTGLSESYYRSKTITGQLSVSYDKTFAEKHNVSALFLTELMDYYDKSFSAGRGGYITNAIDQLFAGGADQQSSSGSASESGRISYVGRINYSYASKYLVEMTTRYDGSPKFPKDGRWGFFPSVSLGWRLSEENFMKENVAWLDNMKLRLSYSNLGYDAIGSFQYLTGYQFGWTYVVDQAVRSVLVSKGLSNPNITWEEMTIYNAGLDFSVFNGKLYGEFDAFYRDRTNMLGNRVASMPNTFGASLPAENINSMTNRGVDLKLGRKGKIGEFTYDISANFTWARAKWNHYDEPEYTDPDDIRINKVSGNWANRYFGYQSDGLFTSQSEIDNYKLDQDRQKNKTLQPGDIKYIDQNKDGILDWKDKVQIGLSNDPEIMFGTNISLGYKGFDLTAFFQGAARRSLYIYTGVQNLANSNDLIYKERWTESNNNKWSLLPRQYVGGKSNNSQTSDFWLKDASYLRLKTMSVGYNIPKILLSKAKIENARVFLSGTNLFTISGLGKYNVDPEGQGVANYYPQQKLYTIGINLKF